ncbi:T-complex protein 1 subunit delta isoform X2 [Hydra vulgaris]|uniref:T-complex protein 1 subunit delta n=1 Tax=Hydra vulgaris TaxID=6087 RepID=A0ABM4CJ60_HYDVU
MSETRQQNGNVFKDREKPTQVRSSNITAAKGVADAIRTSLGPKGMDKMIRAGDGNVTITNDGATILKQIQVLHPVAKMLVELSKAQDVEAGDGTTSVVVIAGSLLSAAQKLLDKGIHPTIISESFQRASLKACEIVTSMSMPVDLSDRDTLLKSATTSLSSKVVSQYSGLLAPICVDSVLKLVDPAKDFNVDLRDIKLVTKLGGTVEDTELVDGLVLDHRISHFAEGVARVEKARIGLLQFCISPPKTDMENNVIVSDYTQMDRVLREERVYILEICKAIKKAGINVVFLQKSILRDAINDMGLHFLGKMKIMVVRDIERDEVEFICKTLGCRPIASVDHLNPDMLASADLVEEYSTGAAKVVKVTGIANPGKTVSILVRGSNKLVIDEAERSIHDALCVIRCLVKKRALLAGGGAPEIECSVKLLSYAKTLVGEDAICFRAFAEALEIIPYTLAENAGLTPISVVTDLRNRHNNGEVNSGINVRKGCVTNMVEENVLQPLLITLCAISLAAETVRSILKIDDITFIR